VDAGGGVGWEGEAVMDECARRCRESRPVKAAWPVVRLPEHAEQEVANSGA